MSCSGECGRLEACAAIMGVRDVEVSEIRRPLSEFRRMAREGNCQVSHSCPHRGACPMGEQLWRAHGINAAFIKP